VLYVLDDINDNELKGFDFFENVFRIAHADKNHSTTTKQAGMLDEVRIVPLFCRCTGGGNSAKNAQLQRAASKGRPAVQRNVMRTQPLARSFPQRFKFDRVEVREL
jgi:hypothetical protein